jgi:hypothetical protein
VTERKRARCPRPSDHELERLTGVSELVEPFALSGEILVPVGSTAAVVRTLLSEGREGILCGFAIGWPGSWPLSPPWIATLDLATQAAGSAAAPAYSSLVDASSVQRRLGPFGTPTGSMAQPIYLRHGYRFGTGVDVGVVVRNGDAGPMKATGFVTGFTGSERISKKNRELIEEWVCLTPPWAAGSVFGGA